MITNPAAGAGRAARARAAVAGYLEAREVRAEFHVSRSAEDVTERAARAAAADFSHVAALGGDGTFHHVLAGAFGAAARGADSEVTLGFLPAGAGNDIAEGLGIPADPVAAAKGLLRWPGRRVDVLRATFANGATSVYIGAGGTGLDAEANRLAETRFRRLPGALRYVGAALWALAGYRPAEMEVTLDGETRVAGPLLLAAVANAPSYGAGVRIAPAARMDDGTLDVTLVGDLPWWQVLEALPVLLRTGDVRLPQVRRFRAQRVRLRPSTALGTSAARPAAFYGDGERLGELPVEVEVLPAAVRVAAP